MVRRFIRNRLRLIDLLDEQKQAIINRVVTRGLDASVRLAPSDINWLGDVPEHWEVGRLKNWIGPVEQGWSPQCDAQPAGMDEWGVMKVGCANKGYFDASQNKKLPDNLAPIPSLEIRDGDVLVSRANTRELLGSAAVAQAPRANRQHDRQFRRSAFAVHRRKGLQRAPRCRPGRIRPIRVGLPRVQGRQRLRGRARADAEGRGTTITHQAPSPPWEPFNSH